MTAPAAAEPRLLVVADLDRLGPIMRDLFAPTPIYGVPDYLAAVAEIPRAPTRAVLVGVDPACRRLESAVSAMREAAGQMPLVFCCEPAYESLGRRAVQVGADDYIIFPPRPEELSAALRFPTQQTRRRWIETPQAGAESQPYELQMLADVVAELDRQDRPPLETVAELVRRAMRCEWASVLFQDDIGRAGPGATDETQPVLVQPIEREGESVGQIRVGRAIDGAFSTDQAGKLAHYGRLIGGLLETCSRLRQWRDMAYRDDLTGLPNRRYLMRYLDEAIARAARDRRTVTALVFDIDDFKRYNDQYGHPAGDAIIREIAQLFLRCCRRHDVVCRVGGDEFVVIFGDAEPPRVAGSRHPQEIITLLHRFRAVLQQHSFSRLGPEATGCLTISGGLASYPWQAAGAEELIEAADRALLEAKSRGKNCIRVVGAGDVNDDAG